MSGDDDLFVNQTATATNTSVELHPDSFTRSKPRPTFISWIHQKKRHMSSGRYYRSGNKYTIGLFFLSLLLFYGSMIAYLVAGGNPVVAASVFALRLLVQLFIFGKCMQKLGELDVIWMVPVFDIFAALLYPVLSLSNYIFKDKTWK
jgi:hypothetical protein